MKDVDKVEIIVGLCYEVNLLLRQLAFKFTQEILQKHFKKLFWENSEST